MGHVPFSPGDGAFGAADIIDGDAWAGLKIGLGAEGTAAFAEGGAGPVTPGTQRSTLASNDPAVVLLTALLASATAWAEGDRAAGNTGAKTTRVVIASDQAKLSVDGGAAHVVRVVPSVTQGAYSVNDFLGSKMTVTDAARTSGGSGLLTGITLVAQDDNADSWTANAVEVLLFEANPAGTFADNAPLSGANLSDVDALLLVGSVLLDQRTQLGNISMLKASNLNMPYRCSGSDNLVAVAINRAGVAPEGTSALAFTFHMIRD